MEGLRGKDRSRKGDREMKGLCAKQTVAAFIITDKDIFAGFNYCEDPQVACPRIGLPSGEGYELCRDICKQKAHAEINALEKAGIEARGGVLILIGHTYVCRDCQKAIEAAGIKEVKIVTK